MEIYCLFSTEDTNDRNHAAVNLRLDRDEAVAEMKACFDRQLAALSFDMSCQTDDHHCSCDTLRACIVDGMNTYIWSIQKQELDIQVAVEVQDGLVQTIYANADISAEVYDLDSTDVREGTEIAESDIRKAELDKVINWPGWRAVW